METTPQEIREYVDSDGRNHFREWIRGLKDIQARALIRVRLNRIRLGNFGDSKSLGDGVCELRIPYGPGYRVYFGRIGMLIVILLCGGEKGTQKKDIMKAKEFWEDFKRRSS
jgi:putative addiction module killer protein